jgi:exonuclease III
MYMATYNILSGGNSRLAMALQTMESMNIDLGVFTETKLIKDLHTHGGYGYTVCATESKNTHQGGVALFYKKAKDWHIEGVKTFGPNVIGATLVSGSWRRSIIGAYIPPSEEDGKTLEWIELAADRLKRNPIILLGDLNVNLLDERERRRGNRRQEDTVNVIELLGLKTVNHRFRRKMKCGVWTWWQRRTGRIIKATADYILAQEVDDITSYRLKTPRYDSDHRLVKAGLRTKSQKEHQKYVRKRTKFPIPICPKHGARVGDETMKELCKAAKELDKKKERKDPQGKSKSWISEDTFRLMRKKALARRFGLREQTKICGEELNKSLDKDRTRRYDEAARELERLIGKGDIKGAFAKAQNWYRKRGPAAPKPTYHDEESTRKEFQELHTAAEPAGEPIPIHISPTPRINDNPPEEDEVKKGVRRMNTGKAAGASGITAEHLKEWMEGAEDEETPTYTKEWRMVLKLVAYCFTNDAKDAPKAFEIGILTLIPKDITSYRGIVLLESIYKLASIIVTFRLSGSIQFHDAIHGFRAERGTGTAITELKLLTQYTKLCGVKNLYVVFLDLQKAYYTLDRERTLEILEGYGVGPNIRAFLKKIWDGDTLVSKQGGFYGKPFDVGRGVRCGDVDSPIIFNIVIDAIVRDIEACRPEETANAAQLFYADDGTITGNEPEKVQRLTDDYTERFLRVGLKMNDKKTKAMVVEGATAPTMMSKEAFDRKRGVGDCRTHREKAASKVQCQLCGAMSQKQGLPKHQSRGGCSRGREEWTKNPENPINQQNQVTEQSMAGEEPTLPQEYCIDILVRAAKIECPVHTCSGRYSNPGALRAHFRDRHLEDTIVIKQEGRLPRCTNCGIFGRKVGASHQATKTCREATEKRRKQVEAKEHEQLKKDVVFNVGGKPIEIVDTFKYLGRVVANTDSDEAAVLRNLAQARKKWAHIQRVLIQDGVEPRTMAVFYRTVVLYVLLYGSESWVLSQDSMRRLRSFHRRCCRGLARDFIRQDKITGEWICPNSDKVLQKIGVQSIEEYIQRRRDTIMEYAKTRNIYEKCKNSEIASKNLPWWETNYYSDDAAEAL